MTKKFERTRVQNSNKECKGNLRLQPDCCLFFYQQKAMCFLLALISVALILLADAGYTVSNSKCYKDVVTARTLGSTNQNAAYGLLNEFIIQ